MSTKTEIESIMMGKDGLAWIVGAGLSVGDLLVLIFLYRWGEDDLLGCIPGITPDSINDALAFAAENPDSIEGQFYNASDPCALMRAVGLY